MADTSEKRKKKPDPNRVQRQASDPKVSVWVSASAGTGKTKVLTDRVLRLLLDGAKPEDILCMTFTNAGASVMKNRIRQVLSQWATCPEKTLEASVRKLSGKKPTIADKKRARQLFAEFLETPGGMQIQTIHSFSQSLIRRFPIETGIPPYFDVLDDQTSQELLRDAQAEILNKVRLNKKSALAKAVSLITPEVGEEDFVSLIGSITYRRDQVKNIISDHGGIKKTIHAVYDYLGAEYGSNARAIKEQIFDNAGYKGHAPHRSSLQEAADLMVAGSAADQEKAYVIQEWLNSTPAERMEIYDDYLNVFLTAKGEKRKRFATKQCGEASSILETEAHRLVQGVEAVKTTNVANGTEALLVLSNAILQSYERRKKEQNLLDYDDLIYYANKLLEDDGATAWALRKLNGNLSHVLVDEAQDTNPAQWQIVANITREFFNGKGRAKRSGKTMFVVGDEKQSIYSFQRADPEEFSRRKKFFAEQVKKAGGQWRSVDMEVAFRSSPAIMNVVDAVFKNPEAADGLTFDNKTEIKHDPFRQGQSGTVEVHPVRKYQGQKPIEPWSLPLEMEDIDDPSVELAETMADQIKEWLDNGQNLKSRKRAISPSDIMILVRRRSAFVDHMVRALKKRDVPVAGADRMSLRDQIAVMDLVALAEVMVLPTDDYKLACLLKSPLIGMTDQDLEKIAIGRKTSLWQALEQKALSAKENTDLFKRSFDYLSTMKKTMDAERPYEFYSEVLMKACPADDGSGLYAMYSRLGFEAEDPIVEFLNAIERFERTHSPSLQGFLSWLEAGQAEVKRVAENEPENPKVHIMTIHGAKGLEAPIVMLPDTTGIPADNTRTRPKLLWPFDDRKILLWVPRAELENTKFSEEREKLEKERDREYHRLLYVAMTRAEDHLHVYGYQNKKNRNPQCWYDLIREGMVSNMGDKAQLIDPDAEGNTPEEDQTVKHEVTQTARPRPDGLKPVEKKRRVGVPLWARTLPEKGATLVKKFKPSQGAKQETNDNQYVPRTSSPFKSKPDRYHAKVGTLVHELLQYLPNVAEDKWDDAATKYLSKPVWEITKTDQQEIKKSVMGVLRDEEFGHLFGPRSRPEVNLTGMIEKDGENQRLAGQIDRLVVGEKTIWIVDYKNSMHIPQNIEDISETYLIQLGAYRQALKQIYPGKQIKCALLWTREAKMQTVPAKLLDQVCRKHKIKGVKMQAASPAPRVIQSKNRRPKI